MGFVTSTFRLRQLQQRSSEKRTIIKLLKREMAGNIEEKINLRRYRHLCHATESAAVRLRVTSHASKKDVMLREEEYLVKTCMRKAARWIKYLE